MVLTYGDQQLVGPTLSIGGGHSRVLSLEVPGNLLTGGMGYPRHRVEKDFNHGLRSLSDCKGNGFKEQPGQSASPVACLFCLFEVVDARFDGSGGASKVAPKVASLAPDWGCPTWRGLGRDRALTSLVSFLQMTREVRRFVWALANVARNTSTCWRAALYSCRWEIRASSFGDLWFMLGTWAVTRWGVWFNSSCRRMRV